MKDKKNTTQRTEYYLIQQPLPFRLRASSRRELTRDNIQENQEELTLTDHTSLKQKIRPQQLPFFELICSCFSPLLTQEDIRYFCIDIPIEHNQRRYMLARYYQGDSAGDFRLFLLNKEEFYSGEPFFPRIGVKSASDSIEEQDIPEEWRHKALNAYYDIKGSRKAPFGSQPTLLLRTYYKNPDKTKKQIAEQLFKAIETVNNHQKKIGEIIKTSFGITLPDYGLSAARYWYEMGLTFPKVL